MTEVGVQDGGVDPAQPAAGHLDELDRGILHELQLDGRRSFRDIARSLEASEATVRFRAALDAARADVAEAFRLRMSLDEEPGVDEPTRRARLSEIIERCTAADQRLDAESEDFDRLRDLEGRAAEVADEVERRRAATGRSPCSRSMTSIRWPAPTAARRSTPTARTSSASAAPPASASPA